MMNDHRHKSHSRGGGEPSAELSEKILSSIQRRAKRRTEYKAAAFGALLAMSAAFVVFSAFNLTHALSQSGFLQFSGLLFSDFSVITSNLPDFLFSIAESLPAFSFALLFSGLFFSVWSAAKFFHELSFIHRRTFSPVK